MRLDYSILELIYDEDARRVARTHKEKSMTTTIFELAFEQAEKELGNRIGWPALVDAPVTDEEQAEFAQLCCPDCGRFACRCGEEETRAIVSARETIEQLHVWLREKIEKEQSLRYFIRLYLKYAGRATRDGMQNGGYIVHMTAQEYHYYTVLAQGRSAEDFHTIVWAARDKGVRIA